MSLALLCLVSQVANAHEYWLEPDAFMLDPQAALSVTVRIGENLEGRPYPFDPRAYRYAVWSSPECRADLSGQSVRGGLQELQAFGTGLHSLTVSSFEQSLTYPSQDKLLQFLKSVGQEALLTSPAAKTLPDAQITEHYRRSSKLLVHFGAMRGADRRVGSDREWVAVEDGFILHDRHGVIANHPVQIYCRSPQGASAVARQEVTTDGQGKIFLPLPPASQCLLNAVIIELEGAYSDLESDWVSLYLQTEKR
ncbi:DUF4198 domain-containing protein [uncultured Roseobacter sp.]|uniref:DUF4198 domain-containing protein n=1 Tax=uncultured Roseobacter sp. TaxID=114847 RepID=UPI002629FDDC|nr:DUF4198 domain-containing protein [uncultured Roseobacter sp.]